MDATVWLAELEEEQGLFRRPCYCDKCRGKVTSRLYGGQPLGPLYPNITPAPHDKSFLDMQFGLGHIQRLTARQYCDAITALCHNTEPSQSKRLWAAFHETEARGQ